MLETKQNGYTYEESKWTIGNQIHKWNATTLRPWSYNSDATTLPLTNQIYSWDATTLQPTDTTVWKYWKLGNWETANIDIKCLGYDYDYDYNESDNPTQT